MTTQAEVLETIKLHGAYSARLYKFNRTGICVRGIREVAPAERLVEKGVLILKESKVETCDSGTVTHYTWVKA